MLKNTDKVWYACYGSNFQQERFRCYISGGQPPNAKRIYPGCSNKVFPKNNKALQIPGELYFAKSSKTWSGGGAAFIKYEPDSAQKVLGRMYLITREQFIELVQQEIKFTGKFDIDLEQVKEKGHLDMKNGSWYDRIIYLGEEESYPIFSFTNEKFLASEINSPHEFYLNIIIAGLRETYNLSPEEIRNYLKDKKGIAGTSMEKKLNELIEN